MTPPTREAATYADLGEGRRQAMDDPAFTILNDEQREDVVDVTSALEPVEQ